MTSRRKVVIAVLAALAVSGAVAAGVILLTDDDNDRPNDGTTITTTTTTSTTSTTTPPADTASAVWPVASSPTRYSDPVAAATGFAVDYVGFTSPVVGEFRQGDSRSGEVEVQPSQSGPITTVFVRQLGSDSSWWVLGAATADIDVREPTALARVSSPVTLSGISTAFEGTVQVEIREDGNPQPLGSGFVTGGANGELGPFQGTLTFSQPTSPYGAIVFSTSSGEDGSLREAAVLRVQLG